MIAAAAGRPAWILDVAHNPAAALVLKDNLRSLPAARKTFAVCGILTDKDAPAVAREVRDCFDAWWLASIGGARGTRADDLAARIAAEVTAPLYMADDVATACAAAAAAAGPEDRIVVFGSFHAVGPAFDCSKLGVSCRRRRFPNILASPVQTESWRQHHGSSCQRASRRRHDSRGAVVLIVPELLSGPTGPRAPPINTPSSETVRNVTVDLATSKATPVEEPAASAEEPAASSPAPATDAASAPAEEPLDATQNREPRSSGRWGVRAARRERSGGAREGPRRPPSPP